jgi:16S rRNA (cytidine1402-2'-O)-methyltransferase
VLAETDPDRPIAVCRELTKRFEEVVRGTAAELAARFREPVKGEVTIVVGEAPRRGAPLDEAVAAVRELVEAGAARRPAADVVARLLNVSRNELYRGSLASSD